MTKESEVREFTTVESYTLKQFNDQYNVNIEGNMDYIEVHEQLAKITKFSCGIVANDFDTAMNKLLKCTLEYIINIEDTFYLCVRDF
ncbi:hypothetical protein [Staphylococcus shinii]|uniref:hypothetical protein n=1 Tax=Staphylococcus shinii TaxID=2912228 RepID=UPI003EF03A7D